MWGSGEAKMTGENIYKSFADVESYVPIFIFVQNVLTFQIDKFVGWK